MNNNKVMKLVGIVSFHLFRYCYNIITNLESVRRKICLCHLYQGCLRECFYECKNVDVYWPVTDNIREAVPDYYYCVCTSLNKYSTFWLAKAKGNPCWLIELFVLINRNFLEIESFGHLTSHFTVLNNMKLRLPAAVDLVKFLYFET